MYVCMYGHVCTCVRMYIISCIYYMITDFLFISCSLFMRWFILFNKPYNIYVSSELATVTHFISNFPNTRSSSYNWFVLCHAAHV